ncbi:SdrD B-like domain-containing protein, partial [Undibacterium fentianense]
TKLYSGDTVPSKVTTQPTIGVQAVCSISGTKTTSFTAGTTGTITGLVQGETCTFNEVSMSGEKLSDGYTLSTPNQAVFAPAKVMLLAANTNALTVTNRVLPPNPIVNLSIRKSHSPSVFTEGTIGTYSIIVSNKGSAPSNGVYTVTDYLPSGLTIAAIPQIPGWDCSASSIGSNQLSCSSSVVISAAGSQPADHPNPILLSVKVAANLVKSNGLSCEPGSHSVTNIVVVKGGGELDVPATNADNRYEDVTPLQALGAISGEIWIDINHDRQRDSSELPKAGFVVEVLDSKGTVVGTAVTDVNGTYRVDGLLPGDGYSVRFKDPSTGAYYGRPVSRDPNGGNDPSARPGTGVVEGAMIRQLSIPACGVTRTHQSLPLDPQGVVYCNNTRKPVAGVKVELLDAVGRPVPSSCLVGGGSSMTTSVGQLGGLDGAYSFLLANPAPAECQGAGDYQLRVTTPDGGSYSKLIRPQSGTLQAPQNCTNGVKNGICAVQTQETAPSLEQNTTYFSHLYLDPKNGPDVVNNHIPVDACEMPRIAIDKKVDRPNAEIGDSVRYTVLVKRADTTGGVIGAVVANDFLPLGFSYIAGSAQVDGKHIAEPQTIAGNGLRFTLGLMPGNAVLKLTYRVRIGIGSDRGSGINRVRACLEGADLCSNEAEVKVKVTGGVFTEAACVVGKVYVDCNHNQMQDPEELGIPGVRLYLEDGSFAITDVEGKYSRCGLTPTTHVMIADPSTLPKLSRLIVSSNRNAGDAQSLFLDLRRGDLHRADFIEGSCTASVVDEVVRRRHRGEIGVPQYHEDKAPLKMAAVLAPVAAVVATPPEPVAPPPAPIEQANLLGRVVSEPQIACIPRRTAVLTMPEPVIMKPVKKVRPTTANTTQKVVVKPTNPAAKKMIKKPKPANSLLPQLQMQSAPALPDCAG